MSFPKKIRIKVYNKYNGHCAYCGNQIEYKKMQIDHITPKCSNIDNVDDFENLNPSCRRCNHYKRGKHLESFRELMKTIHLRIEKNYINKVAIDYGVIELKPFDGTFYFEKKLK